MPTHLDPAFVEPLPPQPVERDTETGDLWTDWDSIDNDDEKTESDDGAVARIPVTRSERPALVDARDEALVRAVRWHLHTNGYAACADSQLMHRLVMGLEKGDPRIVDHINRDKLDNRRSNLRICDQRGNQANSISETGSSQYKGVHWSRRDRVWRAEVQGRKLGQFTTEEAAARAYDSAALFLFGEFARVNFPDSVACRSLDEVRPVDRRQVTANRKLSRAAVAEIQSSSESTAELATRFGVTTRSICRVRKLTEPTGEPQPVQPPVKPEPDVEALRRRLTSLAKELLLKQGNYGITTGDLRYSAENRGLLTGHESLAFMNALQLGKVIREAGGFATGEHRRSRVASAKRSLNAIYTTREFVPVHPVDAQHQGAA